MSRGRRTLTAIVAILAVLVALASSTAERAAAVEGAPAGPDVSEEVVAAVDQDGSAFVVANLAAPAGAPALVASTAQAVIDGLPDGTFDGTARAQDLPLLPLKVDADALDALRDDPKVTSVVVNHLNTPQLVNSVPAIGGDSVRAAGYDGAGTAIAVIDGGVQWYHPFLADGTGNSRVVAETCFSGAGGAYPHDAFSLCPDDAFQQSGRGSAFPCSGLPSSFFPMPCGHGTHVAGIAAGAAAGNNGTTAPRWGVAPKASILAANVFSAICSGTVTSNGSCTTGYQLGAFDSDIALALNWVNGLRATYNVAAVNLSLGGSTHYASSCDDDTILDGPITTLRNNGVASVVASGNDGAKDGISSPACVSTAIAVGSWDSGTGAVSAFSNSAANLALLAPGDRSGRGIVSSVPVTSPPYSAYTSAQGTSMAAPHVAGAIAVLHQQRPDLTVPQLASTLAATGANVTDASNGITRPRIRLDQAVASVATVPGAPTGVVAAAGAGRVTASWTAPLSGGAAITSYTATLAPGGATCTWTSGPLGCAFPGLTDGTAYTVSVHATNAIGDGPESTPSAAAAPSPAYEPVVPTRYMDTRPTPTGDTFDGTAEGTGALAKGASSDLQVTGRSDGATTPVPTTGVAAVVVNVTVVTPSAGGFLTVYPTGVPTPTASNINFDTGQTIANMAVVQVGTGGRISIRNSDFGTADVIVDVVGWYPVGSAYTPVVPTRYMDTRTPPSGSTFDHSAEGTGALSGSRTLQVTGRSDGARTPVPATGVDAVVLNVTVTGPTSGGYLTVFPTGVATPNASNLNFGAGQTIANMVVVKVGAGGTITISNAFGSAHVVVDVVGWVPSGSGMSSLVPARVMDTRTPPSGRTVDGTFQGTGALAPNEARTLTVAGRGGVPAMGASAVVLNVTVAAPTSGGFLTVYPAGVVAPLASNVNFTPGQVIPNMVIAKVGADGQITVKNAPFGSTPVIVDVVGWIP